MQRKTRDPAAELTETLERSAVGVRIQCGVSVRGIPCVNSERRGTAVGIFVPRNGTTKNYRDSELEISNDLVFCYSCQVGKYLRCATSDEPFSSTCFH